MTPQYKAVRHREANLDEVAFSSEMPLLLQRIYAARSGDTLRRSFALMTFMPLTTTLVVTWIGFAFVYLFLPRESEVQR